jgi:hypothetical protein
MYRTRTVLLGPGLLALTLLSAFLALGSVGLTVPVVLAATANDKEALEGFKKRVKDYVSLVKREDDRAPDLKKKAFAGEIEKYENALAKAIREARPDAKEGDIFTPAVRPVFKRILASELKGSWNAPARKTAAEGNPDADGTARPLVAVNATYRDAPLATIPPSLLQKLPELPEQVEYRIVGRDLVLRDRGAGLIVDFIRDATPPLPKEKH